MINGFEFEHDPREMLSSYLCLDQGHAQYGEFMSGLANDVYTWASNDPKSPHDFFDVSAPEEGKVMLTIRQNAPDPDF